MQREQRRHLQGTAVLMEKDGKFIMYQPGLALIASGETVEAAYRKFSDAKHTFLSEVERAGLTMPPTWPQHSAARVPRYVQGRGIVAELALFLAKTVVVLAVVGALGVLAAKSVVDGLNGVVLPEIARASKGVSEFLESVSGISIVDVSNKAAIIAQDVQAMPRENKESLRQSIGTISREINPLLETWSNPPSKVAPMFPPATTNPGR